MGQGHIVVVSAVEWLGQKEHKFEGNMEYKQVPDQDSVYRQIHFKNQRSEHDGGHTSTFNTSTSGGRLISELKASLVTSSRKARATKRNPVTKPKQNIQTLNSVSLKYPKSPYYLNCRFT